MKNFLRILTTALALMAGASAFAQPVPPSGAPNPIGDVAPIGYQANTTSWKYLQFDSSGNLLVSGAGGGGGGTSSNFAAAFPTAGTAIGVKDSAGVNMTFMKVTAINALSIDNTSVAGTAVSVNDGLPDAGTQRVTLAGDAVITGQGTQTVSGNNIILASQGTNATDASGFGTLTIQVNVTGTVTSGVVSFEGSNDNTNFNPVFLYDEQAPGTVPVSSYSPLTGVNRYFNGSIPWRYFRARISTVIGGGGSLQAFTALTRDAFIPDQLQTPSNLYYVGASAQTATVNNIIPGTSGANATDVSGYKSGSIQVNSTGTAGTFIFEGSNDNVNFQAIPVYSQLILTGTPTTAAVTASASNLIYTFPIQFRYLRLRIATTITGGSIQSYTTLSQAAWTPGVFQVAQATAGNFNVTIGSGTVTTVTTVTTVSTLTTLANGQTAHSSASTGSPVRVGGRVNTTLDTTLVQGDASDLFVTTAGQLVIKDYSTSENDWQASSGVTALATTTSTALKAAGAANIRNYVTAVQLYNTSATVSTTVSILDGASVIWTGYLPATTAALPVVAVNFSFPTPLRGTAATAMNIQLGTTAAAVYYNAQGYQSF